LSTRHCLAHEIAARGDHGAAEAEYRSVLDSRARLLGPDNPVTLTTRYQLAGEIAARGDHGAAEAEYRSVLDAQTQLLGPDNPVTLTTRHQLAHEIAARGDHAAAEVEYRSVLDAQTQLLGPDNPATLNTQRCFAMEMSPDNRSALATLSRLAGACRSAGRLDEAISSYSSYQALLADCERTFGSDPSPYKESLLKVAGIPPEHGL
jgi:hypothetical protein